MEKGITYNYNQETKKLEPLEKKSTKGFTTRQKKTTRKNYKNDQTGRDPFWPINT